MGAITVLVRSCLEKVMEITHKIAGAKYQQKNTPYQQREQNQREPCLGDPGAVRR